MSPERLVATTDRATLTEVMFAICAVIAMCAALVWNAATTNFWDDETMGYFLCRAPFLETMTLMAQNVHHDPPLFELIQQPWVQLVGPNVFLLRLPALVYWLVALVGMYAAAKRLGGSRAGWLTVLTAALMPYHWIFPISMRWYSITACVAVWNFVAFLSLRDRVDRSITFNRRETFWSGSFAGYVISGILLWYANYIAPVYFFGHLLIAMFWSERFKPLAGTLFIAWVLIGISYLPWLPTFFRQIPLAANQSTPLSYLVSFWVLWCGEFVHPTQWWAPVVFSLAGVFGLVLVLKGFQLTRIPVLIFIVVSAALLISDNIFPKRMMLVSPFVAIGLGLAQSHVLARSDRRGLLVWYAFVASASLAVAGSAYRMVQREHWLSYRWFDPFEQIVADITADATDPLVYTNSGSVMFYMGDEHGYLGAQGIRSLYGREYSPKAFEYPLTELSQPVFERRAEKAQEIVVIHHNAVTSYGAVADELEAQLQRFGFTRASEDGVLPVLPTFQRFHPLLQGGERPLDRFRIVVARFEKGETEAP